MYFQEKSGAKENQPKLSNAMLCESCAHTMRGKYSMQKLEPGTEFSCAMGEPGKKVDLLSNLDTATVSIDTEWNTWNFKCYSFNLW